MQENILFECDYNVTKPLYVSWCKETPISKTRKLFKMFYVLMTILSFIMLVRSVFSIVFLQMPFDWLLVFVLLFLFCLYQSFFKVGVTAKGMYRSMVEYYGKENWLRKIKFLDNQIVINDEKVIVNYDYSEIKDIVIDNNYIKLIFNNKTVIRLYSDKFVYGDWEHCREFLKSKV